MNNNILTSKPRYEILDGLRGVAAFIVLIYHHFEVFGSGITSFHGYLAVDFFYILSGFVIGYAYDDRWSPLPTSQRGGDSNTLKPLNLKTSKPNGMTLWQFFKRRLIRLHPMLLMGTFIGLLMFFFGWCNALPNISQAHWQEILMCITLACVMIPVPHSMDIRGWQDFNPLNGNAWTLYFEYFANILYALVIRHFGKVTLSIFVFLSALLTIGIGFNIDYFGVMGDRPPFEAYTFIGGWSYNADQLVVGFSRLLFPFFAGLLIAKYIVSVNTGKGILHSHGFLLSTILLMAVLLVPTMSGLKNGIFETLAILVVFPVIVAVGAKGSVSGRVGRFCEWLGKISYPLYITHSPIIFTLVMGWHVNHPDATADQVAIVIFSSITISVMLAWACLKLYDEPVRKWLKKYQ